MKTIGEKNYYTVKEFAAAAHVSNKAVYQQLKTRLKEHKKNVDGVTMIAEDALSQFYDSRFKSVQGNSSQVKSSLESEKASDKADSEKSVQVKSSQVSSQVKSSLERSDDMYIAFLENEIKEYKQKLSEKDKTIQDMQNQIVTLSNNLVSMSNDSLQQIASITKNIQLLQAAEVREDIINKQEKEIIEEPKKSWFQRIRGK